MTNNVVLTGGSTEDIDGSKKIYEDSKISVFLAEVLPHEISSDYQDFKNQLEPNEEVTLISVSFRGT